MHRMTVIASAFVLFATAAFPAAQTMPASVHENAGTLTDAKGMTLYIFANDKEPDKSACTGNCANVWPPFRPTANDHDTGDWKIITRDDGSKQWAYKGKPLYLFAMDKASGQTGGEGRGNGAWHVAKA